MTKLTFKMIKIKQRGSKLWKYKSTSLKNGLCKPDKKILIKYVMVLKNNLDNNYLFFDQVHIIEKIYNWELNYLHFIGTDICGYGKITFGVVLTNCSFVDFLKSWIIKQHTWTCLNYIIYTKWIPLKWICRKIKIKSKFVYKSERIHLTSMFIF